MSTVTQKKSDCKKEMPSSSFRMPQDASGHLWKVFSMSQTLLQLTSKDTTQALLVFLFNGARNGSFS